MDCANVEIFQTIFELSSDAKLILLAIRNQNVLNIHLKLIDEISGQQLCLSEDILVEIIREKRKIWTVNIDYPCASVATNKRVHLREECGAFLIKYLKKKIVLDSSAILELENRLPDILSEIRNLEFKHHMKVGQAEKK